MHPRFPDGIPLDDLQIGRRYELTLRPAGDGPAAVAGRFHGFVTRRPEIVLVLTGGREKTIRIDRVACIHEDEIDEPLPTERAADAGDGFDDLNFRIAE